MFAVVGVGALLASLLPRLLEGRPFSLPIVFLSLGLLIGAVPGLPLDASPEGHAVFLEHFTEVVVIVALMGAGLSLDRRIGWRSWSNTWRLLAIGMPLTIVCVTVLGMGVLGLAPAAAVLLGAALAPTDPVLAGEVQVGEPATEDVDPEDAEDEVRFSLTSEAGLNDALAFPFALRLAEHKEGFVALAATFLAYGVTELLQGYGFLAVFVAAVTIRNSERFHDYHVVLHHFIEQIERLLTVLVLLLLGAAIADGLLDGLGWQGVAVAAVILLVVRPALCGLSLIGARGTVRERAAIAFFGVRGIGSLYYVAYGVGAASFAEADRLYGIVGLVVAGSVILHGLTAGPVMRRLDHSRGQLEPADDGEPARAAG
jgi:NhaP-type Na+/H+ or K+/H+ antiporter